MLKRPFLKEALIFLVCLWIAHLLAMEFYWYWTIWWFDIFAHFLGGATVAFGAAWFFKRYDLKFLIAVTLLIGLVWEFFEFKTGIAITVEEGYLLDTIIDLVMDVLGSVMAYLYIRKKNNGK